MTLGFKRPLRLSGKVFRGNAAVVDCGSSTTSTAQETNTAFSRDGPCVHFSTATTTTDYDDDDVINVQVAFIPCRQEIDVDELYYNRDEIKQMKAQAQQCAAERRDITIAGIHQVYDAAATTTSPTKINSSKSYQTLQALYTSQSRGLERMISWYLMQQRQDAVQRILQVQVTTSADDADARVHLLRMRSLLASRKARQFAQCLGAADAVDVQQE